MVENEILVAYDAEDDSTDEEPSKKVSYEPDLSSAAAERGAEVGRQLFRRLLSRRREHDARSLCRRNTEQKDAAVSCAVETPSYLRVVAPMVRYSRLPFRLLCRRYGCDLAFTPMIVASAFVRSQKARDSDFRTCDLDRPLIVQFASRDPIEFARASQACVGYADGVDLNCGCPQSWARKDGVGSKLIEDPEQIRRIVLAVHELAPGIPVSVKIRLRAKTRETVELMRQIEAAGVSWLSVHGRTVKERRTPVHYDELKLLKDVAEVPIVANGDLFTAEQTDEVVRQTGADGVMCARGILANPAMFTHSKCPPDALTQYHQLAIAYTGPIAVHHHHLMFMMARNVPKSEKREFNRLRTMVGMTRFLERRGLWPPPPARPSPYAPHSLKRELQSVIYDQRGLDFQFSSPDDVDVSQYGHNIDVAACPRFESVPGPADCLQPWCWRR